MIIYKIVNSWNVNSFPNFSIFKICYVSKLECFGNFWNLPHCKFLESSKLKIFGILQIGDFWNFPSRQFVKFSKLIFFVFAKFFSDIWGFREYFGNFWNLLY